MADLNSCLHLWIISNVVFRYIGGQQIHPQLNLSARHCTIDKPCPVQRLPVETMVEIPSLLNSYFPLTLHILYDKDNEDRLRNLTNLPRAFRGITLSAYDVGLQTLGQALESAGGTTLFLVMCSLDNAVQIFQKIKTRRLKGHSAQWLLALKDKDEADLLIPRLEGLIREGTRVNLVTEESFEKLWVFWSRVDLRGITRFHGRQFTNITAHNRNRDYLARLLMPNNHLLYSNMKGRTLKIGVNNAAPLFSIESVSVDGLNQDRYSGIDLSILKSLSAFLNFKFEIIRSIDNTWGDLQPNGTATGVIGMVLRDEINVALAHMTITKTRAMAADFTHLYYQDTITIISQAPTIMNRTFAVFSPFQSMVWGVIILSILFLGLILKVLSNLTEFCMQQESIGTLQLVTFNIFRSIINQGNQISVALWSHRCVCFAWYSFCLIFNALYSGTLIAVLAIPSYEKPVDSLTDLPRAVKHEGYTLGTSRLSMMEFLFKYATEGIYKDTWALFNHKDRDQSFVQGDLAYQLVLERDKFLYISPSLRAKTEALRYGIEKFLHRKGHFFLHVDRLRLCNRGSI
ncbi:uncharacterized protein LOC135207536 [Macrobrachium nipponense]|uniref:uncharacterized protein LOC135207536 n=1 Tax=Macrobrachium nipponense TaxID=159736 RepID=UPI0030C841D1